MRDERNKPAKGQPARRQPSARAKKVDVKKVNAKKVDADAEEADAEGVDAKKADAKGVDAKESGDVQGPDVPPDRLSIDPTSRHYREELVERGIGIRFRGKVRTNVHEYCISEGWVKMAVGKTVDRHGRPLMIKTDGAVEAWFEDLGEEPPVASRDAGE